MAKTRRIEFRANEDEIQSYKDFASKEGISVSEWLRNAAYRTAERKGYESYSAENEPESVEFIEEVAAVKIPDLKAYKKLVAQLQSRMSLEDAEDEARKRLGME